MSKVSKDSLRASVLALRRSLDTTEVLKRSAVVQERFLRESAYREAKSVALYAGSSDEVQTGLIQKDALKCGKEIFYPRVVDNNPYLAFYRVSSNEDLSPGAYGMLEPKVGIGLSEKPASEIDLIVVPGVAFDPHGARIGYGKGYYDRALAAYEGTVSALAFDLQVVEEVPTEAHDVRMALLVSESRVYRS